MSSGVHQGTQQPLIRGAQYRLQQGFCRRPAEHQTCRHCCGPSVANAPPSGLLLHPYYAPLIHSPVSTHLQHVSDGKVHVSPAGCIVVLSALDDHQVGRSVHAPRQCAGGNQDLGTMPHMWSAAAAAAVTTVTAHTGQQQWQQHWWVWSWQLSAESRLNVRKPGCSQILHTTAWDDLMHVPSSGAKGLTLTALQPYTPGSSG